MTERGPPQHRPPAPDPPETVGRYELLLPIASGGMATVYLARAQGMGGFSRQVALKLSHPHLRERHEFAVALMDEARIAARIRHPNVISVLDVGDDQVGVYLVMEYVEGESLSGLVQRATKRGERLPLRIGLRVLLDALAGLAAAHDLRGDDEELLHVVHRDFSPQNIIVATDGTSHLTDFGIAKAAHRLTHTASGLVKGKLRYMSPEQARGKDVDRRADVWAAGVVAWELVTGRPLLKPSNQVEALLALIQTTPARASAVVPFVPRDLDEAIAHALEPLKEDRCPGADELGARLLAAAKAADLVAERPEVAAYVAGEVGKKLKDRNRRIRDVLAQRERKEHRLGRGAPVTRESPTTPDRKAPQAVEEPAPDLDSVTTPIASADTESDLRAPVMTEVIEAAHLARAGPPPAPPPPTDAVAESDERTSRFGRSIALTLFGIGLLALLTILLASR